MKSAGASKARWVRCPACGQPALYSADNASRPFCSARCRSVDLGAWASENYRVSSAERPSGADDSEQPPSAAH